MAQGVRAAAVLACAVIATGLAATPASATSMRTVCAQSVWIRASPAGPNPIAILYNGEHFAYDHSALHNGFQWAYGYAYGGENTWGWLEYNTITDSNGNCQPPYN